MNIKRLLFIFLFLTASYSSKGQGPEFFSMSQQQVSDKLHGYRLISRDSFPHEFVTYLTFKRKRSQDKLRFYFLGNFCYSVMHFTDTKTLFAIIKTADRKYDRVGEKIWYSKNKTFTVLIYETPKYVVTEYNRGISR